MSVQEEQGEVLTKVESAIRAALKEIQRGGILCVPKSLAQRQLEGAVLIVMRQLAQDCLELGTEAHQSDGETKTNT